MFDKIILYYGNYFDSKNSYLILKSTVCIKILSEKYHVWIKEGFLPIEKLPEEDKKRFTVSPGGIVVVEKGHFR